MKRKFSILVIVVLIVSLFATQTQAQDKKNFYRELGKKLSKNRQDYIQLTDLEVANFREIHTTGIKRGTLYRSSSPIKTWGNRSYIADKESERVGIKTFINLADNVKDMKGCKGFQGSYYSRQKVICMNLSTKYKSKDFRDRLAWGLKLMSKSQPPFLIHCDLGKDRAGFVCALIECLMGASLDEVTRDYLISFYNYFGIQPDSSDYEFIANNEIRGFLAQAFGVKFEEISKINLADGALRYFLSLGLSVEDIEALRNKLAN